MGEKIKSVKADTLLILDLDETLIYATKTKLDRQEDFMVYDYYVYKRPLLNDFLAFAFSNFKTAVWSSASDEYVQACIHELGIKDKLEFVWGRSRATLKKPKTDENGDYSYFDPTNHYSYTKPLKKVKRQGYSLEKIIIVDDSPSKVQDNYGNAIYISAFVGDQEDGELLLLKEYLTELKSVENVRVIEKRFWKK